MLILTIVMCIVAVVVTIAFYIYKKRMEFNYAIELLSFMTNLYISQRMPKEDYEGYKQKTYNEFNFLQRRWLKRLKGE